MPDLFWPAVHGGLPKGKPWAELSWPFWALEFGHFKTVKPGENFRFFARQKFFVFLLASEFRSV